MSDSGGWDRLRKDRDYIRTKEELDPYLAKLSSDISFMRPEAEQFKKNMKAWSKDFAKLVKVAGQISSIEYAKLNLPPGPKISIADVHISSLC